MGFGPPLKRFKPGQRTLSCRQLNPPIELLERLQRMRGGTQTFWSPAGPLFGRDGSPILIGLTPGGGIPASQQSAGGDTYTGVDVQSCSLLPSDDGYSATLSVHSETFVGFNLSSKPVAAGALTLYSLLFGLWVCIWEDCTSG